MSWISGIRQAHRWISIVFTIGVIINICAMAMGPPRLWVGLLALLPLLVLQLSGLYLFVLPYTAAGRRERASV